MNTMKRLGMPLILAGAMLHVPFTSQAADQKEQEQKEPPPQQQGYPYGMPMHGYGYGPMMWGGGYGHMREPDMIYGYELMTPKERVEYMDRLHSARNFEQREKIRNEHYRLMQERARKRGETLPGMGPGPGGGYYGPGGPWR
jgi:hypothetical protein